MSLSSDQFMQIIRSLRSEPNNRRKTELRSAPRVGMRERLLVIFHPEDQGSRAVETWVRDMSASGIGIIHSQAVPHGARFIVQFPARSGKRLSVLYSVAHCEQLASNLYSVGARLVHIFPDMKPTDWQDLGRRLEGA